MKIWKIGLLLAFLLMSLISIAPNIASAKWCTMNAIGTPNMTNITNPNYGCTSVGWHNYTVLTNDTNPLNNVMNTITDNFGWFWSLALAVIYCSLFMVFSREPTRNKFIGIGFLGLVITTVFRMYGLVNSVTWFSSWAIMIFIFILVRLT